MSQQQQPVCVVTGSNKGLGLALVRGLCRRLPRAVVYLTARDDARGRAAAALLHQQGLHAQYHQLDVTDRASVRRLREYLQREHGGLDLLVNNAAIAESDLLYATCEESERIVETNYRSVLTVQHELFPLLRRGARVLNVSSDCGHLSNVRHQLWAERLSSEDLTLGDINEFVDWFLSESRAGTWRREWLADGGTLAAYRVAKVALSALTRLQARDLASRGALAVSVHPGLVRTDMTRGVGFLTADEAAATLLRLLLDTPPPRAGGYYWYDGEERDWFDASADYYFKSAMLQRDAGRDDTGERN